MKIQIIIPVFNPDKKFKKLIESLSKQTLKQFSVLLIDSGSDTRYEDWLIGKDNIIIKKIAQWEFNHGGTRQLGVNLFPNNDIYVFFTQDAILFNEDSLNNIIKVFLNNKVGCAFGRQIPHENANFFAKVARMINYKDISYVRDFNDRYKYGMKTVFISNSFAAYRREALIEIGGFPSNTILGEDMWVAANMVMQGWKIAYVAEAKVRHSHNYTIWQEFGRYFDIGVFHSRERWIREKFGNAEGAGMEYVYSEIRNLFHQPLCNRIGLLVEMILRDTAKFIGYRLGIKERYIPMMFKKMISMTKTYW